MMLQSPVSTTPKRKRALVPTTALKASPARLNTNVPSVLFSDEEESAESPRTDAANRLEELEIDSGVVSKLDLNGRAFLDGTMKEEAFNRKRIKSEAFPKEIPETPQNALNFLSKENVQTLTDMNAHNEVDPTTFKIAKHHRNRFTSSLARAYPSINRLSESKSRSQKRVDTPVHFVSSDAEADDEISDPDRADLTWHDDEITGYDPSDSDDDGEGINGIGFKPTAAMARARSERRRQQLADYRSREAKEARARRSERRRGGPSLSANSADDSGSPRKVRFTDAEMIVVDELTTTWGS